MLCLHTWAKAATPSSVEQVHGSLKAALPNLGEATRSLLTVTACSTGSALHMAQQLTQGLAAGSQPLSMPPPAGWSLGSGAGGKKWVEFCCGQGHATSEVSSKSFSTLLLP